LGGSASTDTFKQWVYETLLPGLSEEVKSHVLKPDLTLADVTAAVANYYGTTECTLRQIIKEPDKRNEGRKVAMYLYQEILDERLSSIASYFNLGHSSSVSFITDEIRTLRLNYETFSKKVEVIIKRSMKQVIYPLYSRYLFLYLF
jgi:putative transposase